MKVAQFSLPLSAILVLGLNQSTLAGPQSLLDPYYSVKPPAAKKTAAKAAPVARPAAPSSVVISAPDLPPLKKEKVEKPKKSVAVKDESKLAPEPVVKKAAEPKSTGTTDGGAGGQGFLAGTKQMFHGFGTAAKGAISAPAHAVAHGSKKVAESTKGMSEKVAEGSKSSGGIFVKGAKSVGHGFKAMGEKIKDGTVAVEKKTLSVAHLGGGKDDAAAKKPEASKVASSVDAEAAAARKKEMELAKKVAKVPQSAKIVAEKEVPISNEPIKSANSDSEGLGGKVMAVPAKMGHGIVSAAAKTGEGAKKVAAAPIGWMGKLNPFHHKQAELPPIHTAGKPVQPPQ